MLKDTAKAIRVHVDEDEEDRGVSKIATPR